LEEDPRGF